MYSNKLHSNIKVFGQSNWKEYETFRQPKSENFVEELHIL